MGQKVNPIGFRTGITEDWSSRWFAPKAAYGDFLVEDQMLRRYIDNKANRRQPFAGVTKIEIERTRNEVKISLHTARPGLVIGPKGAEVEKLKDELEHLIDRKVVINILEIKRPDLDAQLVAEGIAEQLKKRIAFRRAMKQKIENALAGGAKGVKIQCSGRLGGHELARTETQHKGSIPLQTLQAHIDYGYAVSSTSYGTIGVKVWVYRGRYDEQVEATEETGEQQHRRPGRRGRRG
jgi:small subunit ribosomal protein S3